MDSEQTNTALGLGVSLDRDAQVKSAGGFMISVRNALNVHTQCALLTSKVVCALVRIGIYATRVFCP